MSRVSVLLAALVTVAAGLGVRALLDGGVAKYGGDLLYAVLVHWVILFCRPRWRPPVVGGLAAAVCWVIEFAQLGEIPAVLRPVLGSTFNAPDLFWYLVGAALATAAHAFWARRARG
ncbi:DUF2809 domain-containing protein [Bailinhaonella thermotolerans]|uniref:DUF2809 domain-containing protein n=1 Tax=Bailinhaonella thermotolerans TaxID=1070861 RepID=A0A3A4API6_9ACTN|nr:DUF2809 domain-containing protein [Bailinhaonella thermotolerans]RJL30355.1 DUF2809 domain-containing protein [Bailinhaonella thermotolerans]